MHLLSCDFRIVSYCSCWLLLNWTTKRWKCSLHKLYNLLILLLTLILASMDISNAIRDTIISCKTEGISIFVLLDHTHKAFKLLNFWLKKDSVEFDHLFTRMTGVYCYGNNKNKLQYQRGNCRFD